MAANHEKQISRVKSLRMSANGEDQALADISNKMANTNVNADALKRVKDAQWAEPSKFDYDAYNAAPRDQVPAAGADQNGLNWAANAVKYEWSDEYGDVGPEHPALEAMLFGDEHKMQKGDEFHK